MADPVVFENETVQTSRVSYSVSKSRGITGWVMAASGGRIQKEKDAQRALLWVIGICVCITLSLLVVNTLDSDEPPQRRLSDYLLS